MDGDNAAKEGTAVNDKKSTDVLDITVLMGGPSAEREVSLLSGEAIARALETLGHCVTRSDINPQDVTALEREGADLVFIALHGAFGESGEVQQLCEARGLRYTGSGPRASELALNKAAAKQIFKRCQCGLATPDWMILEDYHSPEQIARWLPELGVPVVVKPVDGGSSLDITIARSEAQRDALIDELMDRYGRVMLERFIEGRELTVGILGQEALPVLEIIPEREFYDYTAKYADGVGTQYVFDHGLADDVIAATQKAALAAHNCLDCRHMSRVDFILDADNTPQVLEVNTIPGFTSHSLLPMAAAKVGLSFEKLVGCIVSMAMQD